jgi:hypothetical protein
MMTSQNSRCFLVSASNGEDPAVVWAQDEGEAADKAAVEWWASEVLEKATITDVTEKVLAGVKTGR